MNFDPDNWERAKELFEVALDLKPSERPAFLTQNCHDETLRRQIEQLLLNYQQAGNFLDDPAVGSLSDAHTVEESSASRSDPAEFATATSLEVEDPMVGRLLGAYKLVKRIGQGGMAAVFLAVRADDAYRKEVAIKLVQLGSDRHELLSRFRNERQTLAGLDHPNVVKLLDGGSTPEGLPFLVMDYVEGIPIDDYCDRHKLRIDERLRLFSKVCEAVQYAHQKSVVHRDLKPCNILVTSDGTPKLLDFGIAKVLNPNPSAQSLVLTQTGTRCMTPAYASPEQMRGKSITTATDIYSLGVVLYELLTGHRPYRLTQHTPADVERAICEQDPETPSTAVSRVETETSATGVPITKTPELVSKTREGQPEKLRRRLRGDLDNIVLKALQKEPERRYRSVAEFLEDITRHLQHLPVKARPSTLAYRASRFVQRHKIEVLGTSAIISVVVAAALFVMNVFGVRERALGVGSRRSIESLNTSQSFTPKGWVTAAGLAGKKSAVSCESIASLKLPDTTIISTQSIAAGSFTPSGSDPIPNLPAFCRVEGTIKPTADSDIRFEVWMPSSRWNRKFRGVGNAGFGGSINFGDMAAAARNGYATASTDTGHRGDFDDAKWALKHPEKVIDWGYRAIHDSTLRAKRIIQAFYGEAPRWSFFEGCSNGGRAGLMEAQRFPEDYDGILAGAPDIPWTLLTALFYNTQVPGLTSPDSYIPASKIPTISTAVLAACDAQDGVRDGIVNDPRQCHFDPSTLLCKALESDSCLTSPQVAQLRKIYAGLRNSKGDQILPGYLPGGEQGEEGWKGWITGPGPGQSGLFDYGDAYLKNLVFDNPAWDYRTVGVERAIQIADAKTARGLDASDPDIRSFQARGGKLILYSGWSEPVVPPLTTTNYYDSVAAKLGLHETEGFVRLYMAPGMQHCYGGPGPNFFGQFDPSALGGNPQQVPIATDPEHNIFTGLEHWVESSVAPGSIIATKFVNDLDPAQGVKMTRPLCPYPQIAKYKGTGDTNDAANFVCTESDVQH